MCSMAHISVCVLDVTESAGQCLHPALLAVNVYGEKPRQRNNRRQLNEWTSSTDHSQGASGCQTIRLGRL